MVKNLKELRTAANISQQQLADVIGVSQQSINKYENHSVEPDIATLTAIANYFKTSVDYLIGNTDIERRIEAVHRFGLNEEEQRVIEKYRRLSDRDKRIINIVLD